MYTIHTSALHAKTFCLPVKIDQCLTLFGDVAEEFLHGCQCVVPHLLQLCIQVGRDLRGGVFLNDSLVRLWLKT